MRERSRSWRLANPEKAKAAKRRWDKANPERVAAIRRKWTAENRERRLLASAKGRAKKAGLPFDLTLADIVIPATCPVLGIPLDRRDIHHAPSLDRVRPELGYVTGNIRVISFRANSIRQDATAEELAAVAAYAKGLNVHS